MLDTFKEKLTKAITEHYSKTQATFNDLYGYGLYSSDDLSSVGPVSNSESDIPVAESDAMYAYYRYGAVEWQNFDDLGLFDEANAELKDYMNCDNPEWSARREKVLNYCLEVLTTLEEKGVFGVRDSNRFLIIYLSDSSNPIMDKSAKRLNKESCYELYAKEFS